MPDPSIILAFIDLYKANCLVLDSSRHFARFTRQIATHLATFAESIEAGRHPPESVALPRMILKVGRLKVFCPATCNHA